MAEPVPSIEQDFPEIRPLSAPEWNDADLGRKLASMSEDDRNRLAYGVIELDGEGTILSYNQAEADISGRTPEEVLGRNLFSEVAPCLQSLRFYLPWRKTMAAGEGWEREYDYVLNRSEEPLGVKVHMRRRPDTDRTWVLIKRLSS